MRDLRDVWGEFTAFVTCATDVYWPRKMEEERVARLGILATAMFVATWLTASCGDSNKEPDVVAVDANTDFVAELTTDVVRGDLPVPEDFRPQSDADAAPDLVPDEGVAWDGTIPPCGFGCPEGYCDEETGQCLACDDVVGCPYANQWCKDGKCVETMCVPGSKACAGDLVALTCSNDGDEYLQTPCDDGTICAVGDCLEVICQPGESHCEDGLMVQCDPVGVGWLKYPCPPGNGCFLDQCEPIKHNLLLVFDTSGSMDSIGFMDTVPCICGSGNCKAQPFPACEDADCPQSKLGLSKYVFNKFFDADGINNVNIVLTHFAMRIKHPPTKSCNNLMALARGWYGLDMMSSDFMTGDDGSHVTVEGGWFDKYLYEILSVPFPTSWENDDSIEQLKLWVNFNEEVAETEVPCATKADCPGGFCAPGETGSVCWYHTDPELRALSGTPLGRSMFYAGEVFRKQIMPDGRGCVEDADCKNRNYFCTQAGTCKDPFAHCRANMILMFTDGIEDPPTTLSEFFNPRVQAKRFRYGLGCNSDDDCFEDSTCQGSKCAGYPHPNGSGGGLPTNTGEPWRLMNYLGDPLQITTHVIDLSGGEGAEPNKSLADDGGGSYYHADELDPEELLKQMTKLLDIKQNLMDCVPDYEE